MSLNRTTIAIKAHSMNTDTVKARLSSSSAQRSEDANIHLAKEIVNKNDSEAVLSLTSLLNTGTTAVKHSCMKTLYEIGALKPELISIHKDVFPPLLKSKSNRLQWGAMTAIASFTALEQTWVYQNLSQIMEACDKGSVITRDSTVQILLRLAGTSGYYNDAVRLLFEILLKSPVNQVPMYAERLFPIITGESKEEFASILTARLTDVEKESKRKRINKVLQKLG